MLLHRQGKVKFMTQFVRSSEPRMVTDKMSFLISLDATSFVEIQINCSQVLPNS